ncbi:MgtC/SapB family protein [Lentibacillus sediminis]|uniref:MgtC/SapB family protein n=1 Tax=Lentibacillus sediminis TaxID=1940529 RepID=UPI000C1BC9A8|nr:MgtC/SapB family protein [Lentibacillus sediminis]
MDALLAPMLGENFGLMMVRVLVALVLSGVIGFEREMNNHSAGFRTHILVGVGACLMMLLSLFGFVEFMEEYDNVRFDPARIPSYVISGIGFLGAGTIIVYGGTIRGLTTAASIWTVAGIGLVVGAGMYGPAVFTTLIILLSLVFLNNFEKMFTKSRSSSMIEIVALNDLKIQDVVTIVEKYELIIKSVEIVKSENNARRIFIKTEPVIETDQLALYEEISRIEQVRNIN